MLFKKEFFLKEEYRDKYFFLFLNVLLVISIFEK